MTETFIRQLLYKFSVAVEDLDAMIFPVGHVNIALIIQFNSMWYIKFILTTALLTPFK